MFTKEDIIAFSKKASDVMNENKEMLIEMDAFAGDGDLGLTMSKGFEAGKDAVVDTDETDIGKILYAIGSAIAGAAPSTMGTLMGSGFLGAAKALKGKTELEAADFVSFTQGYYEGVQKRSKANPGECTLLDSLKPAWDAADEAVKAGISDKAELTKKAYDAALAGVEATKEMTPVYGKAYVHRDKLVGIADQGAVVGSLLYKAFYEACS